MVATSISNAALQLRCSTPKQIGNERNRPHGRRRGSDDGFVATQVHSSQSRFRVLDEYEQSREAEKVEQIVRDLKAQQRHHHSVAALARTRSTARPRSSRNSTERSNDLSDTPMSPQPPAYDNESDEPPHRHSHSSLEWTDNEEADESAPVAPLPTKSFQEQVLLELQKLKQAQQKDFDAICKLQREKEAAEKRAKALEKQLEQTFKYRDIDSIATKTRTVRPPILDFEDDGGDESAPPPHYQEDTEESVASPEPIWQRSNKEKQKVQEKTSPQMCESPMFQRTMSARSRTPSVRSLVYSERSHRSRRPQSARSRSCREVDQNEMESPPPSISPSIARPRSASRDRTSNALRNSAFFEAKRQAQEEEERRQREEKARLERAQRATPPANLLKRQEEARLRKQQHLQELEQEQLKELAPSKRIRARDVPSSTYVVDAGTSGTYVTIEEREAARKARVQARAQALLASSELPTRMKLAQEEEERAHATLEAAQWGYGETEQMRTKVRKQLQAQAQEEAEKQARKPKPVPNFTHLQQKWDKALSIKKSKWKQTQPVAFFTSRKQEIEALQARKAQRRQHQQEKEIQQQQREKQQQEILLAKARANPIRQVKPTKSDALRMEKIQEKIRSSQKQQEQDALQAEIRALRLKEASKRVRNQVLVSETKRKEAYSGEFVELTAVENVAKEKAQQQRQQFKNAIQKNKEKIQQAIATRPTLMERFTTEIQREEHKKQALSAVVKNVFNKNFAVMKGILNEAEEDVARDLVATEKKSNEEEYSDDEETEA